MAEKKDLRIGELLVEAQILRPRDLYDAIKVAKLTALPVGRILVMSNYVEDREFQAAVQVQSMLRDSIISLDTATKALGLLSRNKIELDEALKQSGFLVEIAADSNKLGELLIDAELVEKLDLERALGYSRDTGLPLGRTLVTVGCISEETLATALKVQELVREGKVDREKGVKLLRLAYERRAPIEVTLQDHGLLRLPNRQSIRLGELLVGAGVISDIDLENALEYSLLNENPIGKALVSLNLIDANLLAHALKLQEMVTNRTLDPAFAASVLSKAKGSDKPLHEFVAEVVLPQEKFKLTVHFHELLRLAGLVEHSEIELCMLDRASPPSSQGALDSGRKLLDAGVIDRRIYLGSLRCYFLIATEWLDIQQGIIALSYFHNNSHESFEDVLHDLGWTVKTFKEDAH